MSRITDKKEDTDILKVVGINSKGYGIFPKLVAKDRRLTPEAKAIYGYFCSYAGAGSQAFPKLETILYDLCMSENRYRKHFNLLKQFGYITVEKIRDKEGKWDRNVYELCSTIEDFKEDQPDLQNEGLVEEDPDLQNGGVDNRGVDNRGIENEGTNINSLKNNNLNTNSVNSQSVSQSNEQDGQIDGLIEILKVLEDPHTKQLLQPELIKSLEGIITQMYFSSSIKIDDAKIPQVIVRKTLSQITPYCLEHTSQKFDEYTRLNDVKNPKKYLQAILYNSIYDEEISVTSTVNYKVFGNGRKNA